MGKSWGEEAVSEPGGTGSEAPVEPPRGQGGEQSVVGAGGISADAETSALAVFVVNVFHGLELRTGDMLGRLDEPLQGFVVC